MRENRSSGSVGEQGGNDLLYPDIVFFREADLPDSLDDFLEYIRCMRINRLAWAIERSTFYSCDVCLPVF